jgi:hypothetical protein
MSETNLLGPLGQAPSAAAAARVSQALQSSDVAAAHFSSLGKALKEINNIREGLTRLSKLADTVTQEDVMEEAGKLVARGSEPMRLAGFLADMPAEGGGSALAGWIAEHAQTAAQTEQKVLQMYEQARYELGVTASHALRAASTMPGPAPSPMANPKLAAALGFAHPEGSVPGPGASNPLIGAPSNAP